MYLRNVHGYSALATGLAFLPAALVGTVATRSADGCWRVGARTTILTGLLVGPAGMALLAVTMSPSNGFRALLPGVVLISVGQGLTWTAMFAAAATGVASHHRAVRSVHRRAPRD